MIRRVIKTGVLTTSLVPFFNSADKLEGNTETERKANVGISQDETGWERVKRMFEVDEFGNISKELVTVLHAGFMSSFIGALYGGVMYSRIAYVDFIKNNQATAFRDHLDAKKKLQDKVSLSFAKGAWRWSWRLTLFTTSFLGISTVISVYRGSSGILEYIGAGILTGSLYKFNMGPRGWIVGGALGGALGLIAGSTTWGLLKLTGRSMDEVRYWQYHWRNDRDERFNKAITAHVKKEEGELVLMHDLKLGEGGKSLDDLDKS